MKGREVKFEATTCIKGSCSRLTRLTLLGSRLSVIGGDRQEEGEGSVLTPGLWLEGLKV